MDRRTDQPISIFCQLHIVYEAATTSCMSGIRGWVGVSRLCGLTSCLAEQCLCTFIRELYSVQCTLCTLEQIRHDIDESSGWRQNVWPVSYFKIIVKLLLSYC